jgi:hypothetical protein
MAPESEVIPGPAAGEAVKQTKNGQRRTAFVRRLM